MPKIRVLLVNRSPVLQESAARFLVTHLNIEIVGRARSGREALEQMSSLSPDLVLMDVALSDMNGLETARQIKARGGVRVILLNLSESPVYIALAEAVGADGLVGQSELGEQLMPLIQRLFRIPAAQTC